jgi:hypothetical protein
MTSTIDRSFTGTLDVEDQAVSATIRFVGDGVSLLVGGDAVGTWDRHEVDFVPEGSSYVLRAEGDSIRFNPDDLGKFESFLVGSLETPGQPDSQNGEPVSPDRVGFTPPPPIPAPVEQQASLGFDTPPEPDPEVMPSQKTLFSDDALDEPISDLSPSFDVEEDDPEPAISWDSVPDELYAAGLSGGTGDFSPPPFRSAMTPQPEIESQPSEDPEAVDEGDRLDQAATEAPVEPEPQAPPAPEGPAHGFPEEAAPSPPTEPAAAAPDASAIAEETDLPGSIPAPPEPDPLPDPAPAEAADSRLSHTPAPATEDEPDLHDSSAEVEAESSDDAETTPATRLAGRGAGIAGFTRNVIDAFRDRPATDGTESTETADEREEGDITPEPIDDRENLRQWGLVVAGGLVLLALIAMVTWGLTSMLGGDEPLPAADATIPTTAATTAATVATTTPTTTPPLTTISPENQAAAAGFVESWNRLATQYAYHLSISADSLPISVAPAPTVHLTYDESGVLGLKMAPKGTGSDRDLLLAMGLAVAWGDPSLSPEGRKEVLGAMGVDVDDPELQEMGGSLSRNGVSYDAAVSDGLIEFRVAPEA